MCEFGYILFNNWNQRIIPANVLLKWADWFLFLYSVKSTASANHSAVGADRNPSAKLASERYFESQKLKKKKHHPEIILP